MFLEEIAYDKKFCDIFSTYLYQGSLLILTLLILLYCKILFISQYAVDRKNVFGIVEEFVSLLKTINKMFLK